MAAESGLVTLAQYILTTAAAGNTNLLAQDRDRRTMLFEERLEAAERRRLEGNTFFAQQQYKEALAKYALVRLGCAELLQDTHAAQCRPHLSSCKSVIWMDVPPT